MQQTNHISEEMKIASALKYRTIYMDEDFAKDSCFKLNYYLDRYVRLDKENNVSNDDLKPITIYISSFGGSIYDGLSSISRIEKMIEDGYEIVSIIDGYAMSMGSALSQVCSTRKARRYSTILYHQVSSGAYGTTLEVKNSYEEQMRLQNLMKEITMKHTKMDESKMNEIFDSNLDVYMTPQQALQLGVIDEII